MSKQNKKIYHSRILKKGCWCLMLLLLFGLFGCNRTKDASVEPSRYIAVICKGSQHEFWKTVEQGAMDAGEEMNIRVSFEAPEDESQIDTQIEMFKKAMKKKADAIVLAPLDTDQLNPVIEEAHRAGIPVLTLDSDVSSTLREATIGTDNESAGAIAARNAVQLIEGEGQIAVISYVEGAQTATERNNGFINEINAQNEEGKLEVVGVEYCGGDSAVAKEQTLDFIRKYPDLKCIFAANEGCALGVAEAVSSLGRQDDLVVIGFDSSDAEISYLESGAIDGMMVQNPYNMGYLGVRNINKVLDDKSIEDKFDTGATYVTRDNLQDEDIQWLLYPLGKPAEASTVREAGKNNTATENID